MKSRKYFLIVAFQIYLVLNYVHFSEAARSSYGEECTRTQKCDRKAWLSCHEGKCDCSKPDEMLYDVAKAKCVTKSGERCKFGIEESGESALVEITDCTSHANCDLEFGICNCDPRYHEIFNGTCAKSQSFGENCTAEDKCSKFEHLDCVEGTCQCREGESVYDWDEIQCVGLLNKICVNNKCEKSTECKNEQCVCDQDHYEDTGRCVLRKGALENCTQDSECIHKGLIRLRCFNNICNCEERTVLSNVQKTKYLSRSDYHYYKGEHYYHKFEMDGPFTSLCAPLIGMDCPDGYCSANAFCFVPDNRRLRSYDKFIFGKCECLESYTKSQDESYCGKTYNQDCTTNQDCFNDFVCNSATCQCTSPMTQIPASTYCTTMEGGRCSLTSQCVKNAYCEFLFDNNTKKVGHCRCNEGYVRNKFDTCDSGFGESCSYTSHNTDGRSGYDNYQNCDTVAGLTCLNQKCSCPDAMSEYSDTRRKCLRRVGAPCSENLPCVENASCFMSHPDLPPRCMCQPGFKETTNFTCVH